MIELKILYDGEYVQLCSKNDWEFLCRKTPGIVAIAAVTDDDEIILVEQFREPHGRNVIEPPAGLVEPGESLTDAANRELEEETGYKANKLEILTEVVLSSGASSETVFLIKATELVKVGEGGGVASENEDITVHQIPLKTVKKWLASQETIIESIVHSVLYLL